MWDAAAALVALLSVVADSLQPPTAVPSRAPGLVTAPLELVKLLSDDAADGGGSGGKPAVSRAPHLRSAVARHAVLLGHVASLRTRLWWCMFEGAVFFPSLEGAIRVHDFFVA